MRPEKYRGYTLVERPGGWYATLDSNVNVAIRVSAPSAAPDLRRLRIEMREMVDERLGGQDDE